MEVQKTQLDSNGRPVEVWEFSKDGKTTHAKVGFVQLPGMKVLVAPITYNTGDAN